jgi:hypothetical protein
VSNPTVVGGQPVIVLEWALYSNFGPVPGIYTADPEPSGSPQRLWVSSPRRTSFLGGLALHWRLPTPEELSAYQLGQLAEAGL